MPMVLALIQHLGTTQPLPIKPPKKNRTGQKRFSIRTTGLGNDYQAYDMDETLETNIDGVKYTGERKSRVKLYQQDNSLVLGMQTLSGTIFDSNNTKKLTSKVANCVLTT